MKIAIDVTSTQDEYANQGPGRYTVELIENMIKNSEKSGREDLFYLLTFNSPTTLQSIIANYSDRVRTVNIGRKRLSLQRSSFVWRNLIKRKVRKLVKDEKISLYFCPNFWEGFPILRIPTIVMVHDLAQVGVESYSQNQRYSWKRPLTRLLKKLPQVDGVLTNSNNTMEDIIKFSDTETKNIKVIPLGISDWVKRVRPRKKILEKYLPQNIVDSGYIFYEGGASPSKNIPGLLYSYSELVKIFDEKKDRDIPYLVIGGKSFTECEIKNKELDRICRIIEEESLQDKIVFTGFFDDEDLNDLLCASKLFIHLSLYEGFGFSPLQAMRAGVPVIASNVSCYPDILGDGALLVDPTNYKNIAKKVYEILNDKRKSRALSNKGVSWSKRYSWERTAEETQAFFVDIVSKFKSEK
jgi:glycosyltransferase involved in cell wall biosynthesis